MNPVISREDAVALSQKLETIEFSLRRSDFDRNFPDAFSVANPSPKFTLGERLMALISADWPEESDVRDGVPLVRCRAVEYRGFDPTDLTSEP